MSHFSIRTQTFRLGLADYRALWLSPRVNAPAIGARIGYTLAIPLVLGWSDLRHGDVRTCLFAATIVLILNLASFIGRSLSLWWRYRHNAMMTGDRIMILDDGAVRLIGDGFDVRQPWGRFLRVCDGHHHLFLLMRDNQVYIIPKTALGTAREAKRLVDTARAAIRAAAGRDPVLPSMYEPPEGREIWLSRPYRIRFGLPFARFDRILWSLGLVLAGVVAITLAMDAWTGGHGALHEVLGLIGSLAMGALVMLALLSLIALIVRRRPYSRGEQTFCFTRDYIRCRAAAFDGRFDWDVMRDVRQVSGAYIFRLPTGRFTVPATAFATPAQATAFFTQAVAFWRAAEARREFPS